jgi:pantoate--beta-alanine ligase
MIIAKKPDFLSKYLGSRREIGVRISLVPTMGALHEGHLTLIQKAHLNNGVGQAREADDLVVCSIFVNPTQFNDPKDYQKYPKTIDKDVDLLEKSGADILFLPDVADIYPTGMSNLETYDLGDLEKTLEGEFRPGHFQGVCQVMRRILDIVKPDQLFMGQKDYQQCMVVKKLIQIVEAPIQFVAIPTVREKDGLAMSSRNLRLDPAGRKNAVAISQSLDYIKRNIKPGDLSELKKKAKELLEEKDFKVDYIELADANNLNIVRSWDGKQKLVALIAAFQHEVRLIDNLLLN